jgi:hypothetical protein
MPGRLIALLMLPALVACAGSRGTARPEMPASSESLGRIGLIAGGGEPAYTFDAMTEGKGEGAAVGALEGAGLCAQMAGGDAGGFGAAVAIVCLPFGLLAGAIHGGAVAAPEQSVDDARRRAQQGVDSLHLNRGVVRSALDYSHLVGLDIRMLDGDAGVSGTSNMSDYAAVADSVDTVIELNVERVGADSNGRKGMPVSFEVHLGVRLLDVRNHRVLDAYVLRGSTVERPADDWLAADAAVLRADLEARVRELVVLMIDDIVIYRPAAHGPAHHSTHDHVPGYALAVVDPPIRIRLPGLHPFKEKRCGAAYQGGVTYGWLQRAPLASVQPTFRWESLPRDFDREPGDGPGQAQDLRYDLRVLDGNGVVYERYGLTGNSHTLESALSPCQEFRWTVRARFKLDGNQRATEWTGAYDTIGGYADPMWIRGRPGQPGYALIPRSLVPFFPIVKTPGADGRACKCL